MGKASVVFSHYFNVQAYKINPDLHCAQLLQSVATFVKTHFAIAAQSMSQIIARLSCHVLGFANKRRGTERWTKLPDDQRDLVTESNRGRAA